MWQGPCWPRALGLLHAGTGCSGWRRGRAGGGAVRRRGGRSGARALQSCPRARRGGMRQGVLRLGRGGPSVPVLGRLTGPLRFCCVCGSPRVLSARPPRPRGAVDGPEWVSPGGGPAAPRRCPARGFASSPPGEAGGSGVMPRGRPAPERLARTGALLLRPFR